MSNKAMKEISLYYKKEVEKLTSSQERIKCLANKCRESLHIIKSLRKSGAKSSKTSKVLDQLNNLEVAINELQEDPWMGECPYNDPTLDWRDPYYMKKPFGNTPEELKKIGENMAEAIDKRKENE